MSPACDEGVYIRCQSGGIQDVWLGWTWGSIITVNFFHFKYSCEYDVFLTPWC